MSELYEHQCVLFAALLKAVDLPVYKTPVVDGWFVDGVILPSGQVGYHLPAHLHHQVAATVEAPIWDGHTSADSIHRLMKYLDDIHSGE